MGTEGIHRERRHTHRGPPPLAAMPGPCGWEGGWGSSAGAIRQGERQAETTGLSPGGPATDAVSLQTMP